MMYVKQFQAYLTNYGIFILQLQRYNKLKISIFEIRLNSKFLIKDQINGHLNIIENLQKDLKNGRYENIIFVSFS
jgi:hypothetical protein